MPLLVWMLGLVACTDPQQRYDAFIERSADMRGIDAGAVDPGRRFDFSGRYLCALATTLAPDQPILLACNVSVSDDLSTVGLTLQPLTTDEGDPSRAPVGDPSSAEIPFEPDGSFNADLGELTVPGAANPISGSDIVARVQLNLSAREATSALPVHFCGRVSGTVSEPLQLDLAGSTLGALRTPDVSSAEPLLRCPD